MSSTKSPIEIPRHFSSSAERAELANRIEASAPLLTLEQLCIVHNPRYPTKILVTGAELQRAISYQQHAPELDSEDVNIQLRGLAELLAQSRRGDGVELGSNALWFLERTLEHLAARLENSEHTNSYRIALLVQAPDRKAVA
jgi:hypothetical protein